MVANPLTIAAGAAAWPSFRCNCAALVTLSLLHGQPYAHEFAGGAIA